MPDVTARRRLLASPGRLPIVAEMPAVRGDASTAVLRLYDPIDSYGGPWGISAKEMAHVLDDLPDTVEEIRLHVNSPGGEVFDGIAILNALRTHPARVVAVVDGIAASAASFIAVGADELVMAPNSELMIHDAWGVCVGNAEDMRLLAAQLDQLSDNIASIYRAKAGGDLAEWRAAMAVETWFTADEAVAVGLADRVDGPDADDEAKARFDLSGFKFSGRRSAPGPQHPAPHPVAGPNPHPERRAAVDFTPEQLTDLRQRLGLADDADETAIKDALMAPPVPPDPSPPAELPEGVVAISAAQLDQLRADAAAGVAARDAQIRAERLALVDGAVRDGRIAPVERDAWMAKLDAGTGAEQVLAALKPGVVPVAEVGSDGAGDSETEEDRIWSKLFPQGVAS